jgi:prolyl oligopeptidase
MRTRYPETRIEEANETLGGVSFVDPYRWLEEESEEVRQWQQAQNELASRYVRGLPQFQSVKEWLHYLHTERITSLPRLAAGRWFRVGVPEGRSYGCAIVSHEPCGDGRVLFDPHMENRDRPLFVSWVSPSPDGRTLAVGVCRDGSEQNSIRLLDVDTRRFLVDPPSQMLMDNWTGGAHWLPDSSGFFFTGLAGESTSFRQQVFLHRRTPSPETTSVDIAWTQPGRDYRMVTISHDGNYAVALERRKDPIPVAVAKLGVGPIVFRPFVTRIRSTLAGHVVDGRYVAITDLEAPRGRVVAIPLDARDPNDPGCWQELIAESESVLRNLTPVGDRLYLTELVDTYSRIKVTDLCGRVLEHVPLPNRASVGALSSPMTELVVTGQPDKFVFSVSSLSVSPGIYRHTPGESRIETLQSPKAQLDDVVVEDAWVSSADGTLVPYHIVRRADVSDRSVVPTLICAYGGFNQPFAPQFPAAMAAFVAMGGQLVHAHLRGGGELGRAWWEAGRLGNKQNSFNDLYAIAERLIAAGRCAPECLALVGQSNGGLLAGVAATQRPELWAAVVPRVPFLDCIGGCRDPYGRNAVSTELADIEDPNEVARLAQFSPYHLVREGVRYPAIFMDAGATDPRCPAWHARKFAARLQRAQAGGGPILLHVWEQVGHGAATHRDVAIDEHAEWLAFVAHHTGLEANGIGKQR